MRICLECKESVSGEAWRCAACGYEPPTEDGVTLFSPELAKGTSGFDEQHFPALAAAEDTHFWHRSRRRLITWALDRYFPTAKSFMEIGCGTGFVLAGVRAARPQMEIAGSEAYPSALKFAAARLPGAPLWQMDARQLPFRDELDVIGAFDVIEHIEEDERVLREMHRAVKKPGGILLTVPQHAWLWSAHDEAAHHVRRYSAKELVAKVERAGFEVVRVTSFVSALLPAMWLQRRRSRVEASAGEDAPINPIVNRAFEAVLNAEIATIQLGASLPVGGSLLVVARA